MNAASSSTARKVIPKKLCEDLNNLPRFKVGEPSKNVREVFNDSTERAMYDELFGGLLNKSRSSDPISKSGLGNCSNGDPSNAIILRLERLEMEAKSLRNQLAKSTLSNESLLKENKYLKEQLKSISEDSNLLHENDILRNNNDKLVEELESMHKFLADYGLEWVGESDTILDEHVQDMNTLNDINANGLKEMQLLFEKLQKKVNYLNEQIHSEESVVKTTDTNEPGIRRARLVHGSEGKDTLTCTFYYNGIMINRGPFRFANTSSYNSFIQDILDGYFPLEFKSLYPDGMLFNLINKHHLLFDESNSDYKIGNNLENPMKASQLMDKLPKVIVQNGNIMTIRQGISDKLNLESDSKMNNNINNAPIKDKPVSTLKNPIVIQPTRLISNTTSTSDDIGIVYIKLSSNQNNRSNILQLHIYKDDLIRDLIQDVCEYVNNNTDTILDITDSKSVSVQVQHLDIRNTYPPRVLNLTENCMDAKLYPKGNVQIKITV